MMTEQWLFTGYFSECLGKFFDDISYLQEKSEIVTRMANFVGCSRETIFKWMNGKQSPSGEHLIKTRYYLWCQGYQVIELSKLDSVTFLLGKLIAFKIADMDSVADLLGYSSGYAVMRILHGQSDMSSRRYDIAKEITTMDSNANEKMESIIVDFCFRDKEMVVDPPKDIHHKPNPETRQVDNSILAIRKSFAKGVEAIIPLAEILISNALSDEERRDFRHEIPNDGLFILSNLLSGLCSKESRRVYLENQ